MSFSISCSCKFFVPVQSIRCCRERIADSWNQICRVLPVPVPALLDDQVSFLRERFCDRLGHFYLAGAILVIA